MKHILPPTPQIHTPLTDSHPRAHTTLTDSFHAHEAYITSHATLTDSHPRPTLTDSHAHCRNFIVCRLTVFKRIVHEKMIQGPSAIFFGSIVSLFCPARRPPSHAHTRAPTQHSPIHTPTVEISLYAALLFLNASYMKK